MRPLSALFLGLATALPTLAADAPKPAPAKPAADGEMKKETEKDPKAEDPEAVTITPFRSARLPVAKETRTFHLAKLNKPLAFETTRELQRLFAAFASQHLVDAETGGFSKAPGSMAAITYTIVQDLGENRFLAKGNWPALNGDPLLEGKDSLVVLLLDKPATVGAAGRCTGLHVGMVALGFTAKFAPLEGKKLTLRREAFLQCTPVDESNAALQKFVESIQKGAQPRVIMVPKAFMRAEGVRNRRDGSPDMPGQHFLIRHIIRHLAQPIHIIAEGEQA